MPIEIGERIGRKDFGRRDDRLADFLTSEAPANGIDREPSDDLWKQRERRFQKSAAGELVQQRAALSADRIARDWRAEPARDLQGTENCVIVDAENDVDGRPRAKRLLGLPHSFLEDAAAVVPDAR